MSTAPRRALTAALLAAATAAALSACGTSSAATGTGAPSAAQTAAAASTASSASTVQYPLTVDNCGTQVTVAAQPRRIVMVNNDELANLEALDAVDRVVAVTATPQADLYEPATASAISALAVLSTQKNATGGSVVSQESILGATPDLVIAPENAVDRQALAAAGIPVISPTAYCADPPAAYQEQATFTRVWDEVTTLGQVLGVPDHAAAAVEQSKAQLDGLTKTDRGTAAALYVSSGGAVLSPYGGPSMVTPVFEAAGLTNVYAGATERVFDANVEDITAKDPATIVLLYSGTDPQSVLDAFASAPGTSSLSAVRTKRVVALPFPYTDPPSVLSTRGPAQLVELLEGLG